MNGVDKNLGCAKMPQRPKKERLAPSFCASAKRRGTSIPEALL